MDGWLDGHLARRRTGAKHPVEDFLFTYYSHRPSRLRRWSPGAGVVLEGYEDPQLWNGPAPDRARWIVDLLAFAWSYVWLARAELQAGRTEAISPLHGCLVEVLEAFRGQLLNGTSLPYHSLESEHN